jgi:glycerol-1-phosphate dehydrogenase [NAD(P)+]
MDIVGVDLLQFLKQPFQCSCGRYHAPGINNVEIESGALKKVPGVLRENGFKKAFIIADSNTNAVAGQEIQEILKKNDIPYVACVLSESEPVPDEQVLGRIFMRFDETCDVVLAVGAGTINDISRFVSYRLGIPYVIVATAPSMDGYASTVAPLITNNLKTTYSAQGPAAIIADLDIISKAPMEMIAAGFGDILGKYTCLVDWKLSAIINNEYYCEHIVGMMTLALNTTISLKDGLAKRDVNAISRLMESLVLAGVAMNYSGNSRPASGSEHHLSHFWEMRFLFEGRKAILHGTKVGIATLLVLKLYDYLREEGMTEARIKSSVAKPTDAAWEEEIRQAFLSAADEVLELEKMSGKNHPEGHARRVETIAKNWVGIRDLLNTMPSSSEVSELLSTVHGPIYPREVDIDESAVVDGVRYAKEIRLRYTVLQLLWDLGLLDEYANKIVFDLRREKRV